MAKTVHRNIFAVKTVKAKDQSQKDNSYWTKIGVSFLNEDGSENLSFDFYPADSNITIQLRDPKAKDE